MEKKIKDDYIIDLYTLIMSFCKLHRIFIRRCSDRRFKLPEINLGSKVEVDSFYNVSEGNTSSRILILKVENPRFVKESSKVAYLTLSESVLRDEKGNSSTKYKADYQEQHNRDFRNDTLDIQKGSCAYNMGLSESVIKKYLDFFEKNSDTIYLYNTLGLLEGFTYGENDTEVKVHIEGIRSSILEKYNGLCVDINMDDLEEGSNSSKIIIFNDGNFSLNKSNIVINGEPVIVTSELCESILKNISIKVKNLDRESLDYGRVIEIKKIIKKV